jgi:hypothetical protein
LQKRKEDKMPAPYSSHFQGVLKTLDDKWSNWQEEMTQGFRDTVLVVDEDVEQMMDAAKAKMDRSLKKDMKMVEDAAVEKLKEIYDYYKPTAKAIFEAGVDEGNFKEEPQVAKDTPKQQQGSKQDAGRDEEQLQGSGEDDEEQGDWRAKNKKV